MDQFPMNYKDYRKLKLGLKTYNENFLAKEMLGKQTSIYQNNHYKIFLNYKNLKEN